MPSKPPPSSTNFTPLLARCGHFCGYPPPVMRGRISVLAIENQRAGRFTRRRPVSTRASALNVRERTRGAGQRARGPPSALPSVEASDDADELALYPDVVVELG